MAWRKVAALLLILTTLLCTAGAASAAISDAEAEALRQEIALLKERLASMEARLSRNETTTATIAKRAAQPVQGTGGVPGMVDSFAREIEVHGFVDTSYIFNTNTPVAPNPRTNNLRVFDTEANAFTLQMAQLSIEKAASHESPIGFGVVLDYGQDAKLIHSNGLGNPGDEFDLQEAYGEIMVPRTLPWAETLSLKAGKFVTLMGAEVIESMDNWNFSRSYLFGYAIPFTHTGLRAYYRPSACLPFDFTFGVVNGWDQVTDLNKAKSLEAQMNITPCDNLTLTVGGMYGAERADSDKDTRNLLDVILTYQPTERLTLKANYDYGWEENGTSAFAGYMDQKDASWDGLALYAKYDLYDWWSLAGRAEVFHDRNGVRTGFLTDPAMPINDLYLFEYTLTSEWRLFEHMICRLEYRYDKASGQAFTKDKGTANNQSTIAAEVIAYF